MFLPHFLTALAVAIILWAVFALGFRRSGPWPGIILFLAVVFLGTWAGGVWLQPFGPTVWGVAFLPFLLIGILVALLVAAATPPPPVEAVEETPPPEVAVGAFFWVLVIVLLASLVLWYAV